MALKGEDNETVFINMKHLFSVRWGDTVLPAGKMMVSRDMCCDIVGRCCESGDVIQPNISMPAEIGRGDIIACLTTGAYHYSMASNYNRVPRPPVVMLRGGESYVAVRRETPEDLIALDV